MSGANGSSPQVAPALELRDVTKSFPGVLALKGVSFEVMPGEVHALVGENGAGKSTLIAVAAGALVPDQGTVAVAGTVLEHPDPTALREAGMAVVYQHPALVPDLSVAENLALGVAGREHPPLWKIGPWVRERLAAIELDVDPRRRVEDLSVAERHLLEIAKALAIEPTILILDEPTEPLSQDESERLFAKIREATERGVAVVYISHRLPDVERIADRITVLRDGENRGTFAAGSLSEDDILRLIVGRPVDTAFPEKGEGGAPRLALEGFAGEGFGPLSMRLNGGEIVGLAGIDGNGQREFIRALAGVSAAEGTIELDGKRLKLSDPADAIAAGIAHVPADRHTEGLILPLSVRENVTLLTLRDYASGGVMRRGRELAATGEQTGALAIKTPSPETPAGSLSGGNQQKTVFARTLLARPKVLLADEPTQGVDAGARLELYRHLRQAAEEGAVVVVLSSDAIELEGLCDRVLVFSRGSVVSELSGDHVTESAMTHAAITATSSRARRERGASRLDRVKGWLRGDYAPAALLLTVLLLFGAYTATQSESYLTEANFKSYLFLVSILAFVALGQFTVVVLAGVDLSVGPLMSLMVVIASLFITPTGAGALLGIVVMAAIAIAAGTANGTLVRKVQINPVIATLVSFFVIHGIALIVRPTPGGLIEIGFTEAVLTSVGFVPVAFIAALLAVAALEWALRFSRWGVELRATGSEELAAHRLGIKTDRRQIGAYVLCSLLTFCGSILLVGQIGTGDANAGLGFTLTSIAAVVLGGASVFGGRGAYVGVFCGALLLQQIDNATTFLELASAWQYWLVGGLTLLAAGLYSRSRRPA